MRASKRSILHTVIFMYLLIEGIFVPSITLHAAGSGNSVTKKITKQNDRFTVSASYGIDGYVAYDYPAQIKVTVESKENFTGSVRVIPSNDYGGKKSAYGQDISLSANEAKTFSMPPAYLGNNGQVMVQIVDDKGKIIYEEQDIVSISGYGDDLLIGILSDDYSALSYFDGINVISIANGEETANILQLDAKDLDGEKDSISILSYIIIDNYDTANLSEEEYSVLKDWVEAGGILVLSLGSNYQNVLHIFTDDFASGTLGNMDKKNVVWGGSEDSEAGLVTLSSVDVISFAMKDAEEMTDFSTDHTAFQKNTGAGTVIALGYDLAMDPIASFSDRKEIATRLLEMTRTFSYNKNYSRYGNEYNFSNMAGLADDVKKPSVLLYGALLLFYVILVGPVLYLVLKGMKKREKIWIGIPVVALMFTGVIYLTGFLYRIRNPLANTFTVIRLNENGMKEDVYASLVCPKARDYSIQIDPKYSVIQRNMVDYSFFTNMGQSESDFDYLIQKKNSGMEVVLHNKQAFDANTVTFSAESENMVGEIACDLHYYTYGFEGTVTNQTGYDLSGVVVYFDGHFYEIEQLKKGEQAVLNQEDEKTALQYGMFDQSDSYSDDRKFREYRVNSAMGDSFVNVNDCQKGLVWGTIDTYVPHITGDSDWKQNGFGVVYQTFTGEYEDYLGVYCPDIRQTILTGRGDFDANDGMLYADSVNITYSFEEYPGINELQNLNYDQKEERNFADVYAYNAQTDEYEPIFKNSDTLSGSDLQKYINNNILILEFRSNNIEMYSTYMPKISARGDE